MAWRPHSIGCWAPSTSNLPESAVPGLEADPYYRRVTFALVPLLWAAFIGAAWFSQVAGITWVGLLGLIISTGGVGGFCINLGHEIGHKRAPLERWLAKLILAPTFYGHFTIEHNRGHHRDVATPQDPASSRMGESIWRFVWREMPGAWRRAWALERERTRIGRTGLLVMAQRDIASQQPSPSHCGRRCACGWGRRCWAFWCWRHCGRTFSSHRPTTSSTTACFASWMPMAGLKPASRSIPGTATTCSPTAATFHLQRHSDHHAHPLRRYQSLRHFDEAPQLPSGYFGMFPIAYVPPLWFAVMDKRLLAAVGRDPAHQLCTGAAGALGSEVRFGGTLSRTLVRHGR